MQGLRECPLILVCHAAEVGTVLSGENPQGVRNARGVWDEHDEPFICPHEPNVRVYLVCDHSAIGTFAILLVIRLRGSLLTFDLRRAEVGGDDLAMRMRNGSAGPGPMVSEDERVQGWLLLPKAVVPGTIGVEDRLYVLHRHVGNFLVMVGRINNDFLSATGRSRRVEAAVVLSWFATRSQCGIFIWDDPGPPDACRITVQLPQHRGELVLVSGAEGTALHRRFVCGIGVRRWGACPVGALTSTGRARDPLLRNLVLSEFRVVGRSHGNGCAWCPVRLLRPNKTAGRHAIKGLGLRRNEAGPFGCDRVEALLFSCPHPDRRGVLDEEKGASPFTRVGSIGVHMSDSTSIPDPDAVRSHYDVLDRFYRRIWGEHVHHGLWTDPTFTAEEAVRHLVHEVAREAHLSDETRVCDVGCGYGAPARLWAQNYGARITGFTVSEAQYAYAQAHPVGDAPSPTYELTDFLENDLAPNRFDAVVAIESVSHIADPRHAFEECARILRPGGRLVACVWTASPTAAPWERRFLLDPIVEEGRLSGLPTATDLREWAERADFTVERLSDRSSEVQKTWTIVIGRFLKALLTDPEMVRVLFDATVSDRVFARTLLRIWLAYRVGALRYTWLVADRNGG